MTRHDTRPPSPPSPLAPTGELSTGGARLSLRGRALQLALWIAHHQSRINETASEGGQLTLNWKGVESPSIAGELRTRL